ncbi:MAG: YceI family protein [Acidiferrobacterales bacterium]
MVLSVDVTIDAASIDTDVEALDKHLRSPLESKEERR